MCFSAIGTRADSCWPFSQDMVTTRQTAKTSCVCASFPGRKVPVAVVSPERTQKRPYGMFSEQCGHLPSRKSRRTAQKVVVENNHRSKLPKHPKQPPKRDVLPSSVNHGVKVAVAQETNGKKLPMIVRTFTKHTRNIPQKKYTQHLIAPFQMQKSRKVHPKPSKASAVVVAKQSTIVPLTKKHQDLYAHRAQMWADMQGRKLKQVHFIKQVDSPKQVTWKLPWTDASQETIHLFPKKGSRDSADPFVNFIHAQTLWIHHFQIPNHKGRHPSQHHSRLVAVSMKLLEHFYDRQQCFSLVITGEDGCDIAHFTKAIQKTFQEQLCSVNKKNPQFGEMVYQRIRLHSKRYIPKLAAIPFCFRIGSGNWKSPYHVFVRGKKVSLTAVENRSWEHFHAYENTFSIERAVDDERAFGHKSLKSCKLDTRVELSVSKKRREQAMKEYQLLVAVDDACKMEGLTSLRSKWEEVFTARCLSQPQGPACQSCRGCRQRFAQCIFVVIAAAGVSDENILPRLGAVFRSPYYKHFSIEEWALTPKEDMVQIYRPCSKQVQNACFTKLIFEYLSNKPLPTTVAEVTRLRGLEKKSACLLLQASLGIQAGIPVDRHLMRAGKALGWIPDSCANSNLRLAAAYLEALFPDSDFAEVNNRVAGLGQTVAKLGKYKQMVLSVASNMGADHLSVMEVIAEAVTDREANCPVRGKK